LYKVIKKIPDIRIAHTLYPHESDTIAGRYFHNNSNILKKVNWLQNAEWCHVLGDSPTPQQDDRSAHISITKKTNKHAPSSTSATRWRW
jgi:hypothetical protein